MTVYTNLHVRAPSHLQLAVIWLRLLLLAFHASAQSQGQLCEADEYYDTAASKCCSQCQEKEGVKNRCSNSTDTTCVNCPEHTYSARTETFRICKECTSCSPARITTSLCTPTHDTVCGSCAVGWFLFVSSSGPNQCLKCSPCPPGQAAIHWEECAIVGLAEDFQCKPGLYNRTDVLPTNRSGFIAQNNNEVLSNAPSDSIPVIVVTAIALTAGVFAIVFFSVIFVLVSHRICKQERQQYLRLARMQDTELSIQSSDPG